MILPLFSFFSSPFSTTTTRLAFAKFSLFFFYCNPTLTYLKYTPFLPKTSSSLTLNLLPSFSSPSFSFCYISLSSPPCLSFPLLFFSLSVPLLSLMLFTLPSFSVLVFPFFLFLRHFLLLPSLPYLPLSPYFPFPCLLLFLMLSSLPPSASLPCR